MSYFVGNILDKYFASLFSLRSGGSLPYIIDTFRFYGKRKTDEKMNVVIFESLWNVSATVSLWAKDTCTLFYFAKCHGFGQKVLTEDHNVDLVLFSLPMRAFSIPYKISLKSFAEKSLYKK